MKAGIVALFIFAGLLSAQTATTGQIDGTVRDPSGALVAGVKVLLTSDAGLTRETRTGSEGVYLFTLLPTGVYRLEVSAAGFKTAGIDNVAVRITETSHVDVALVVSAAAGEVVNVSAEVSLVQSSSAATGRVVDEITIRELPLATRNFTQILSLSTGTATYLPDNTSVGRNSQNISVNGARVTNNSFIINGADANSIGTNSAPSLAVPAPETLEEFKVQTSMYDATYGRSGGGNIQVITKSGQNAFHGAVYEYFRNDKLNANDPFLKASGVGRPGLKRNVYGATLGGPIKKDRMFFFLSYQGTRESNAASRINSLSSNVLIANGLTNDRSASTLLATFKPTLATGAAVTSINPISLALLNAKLPNGNFVIPTPQAGGRYSGATPSIYHEDQMNANFDDHISSNNTLSAKFFLFDAPQTLVLPSFLGGGSNVPGFGNDQYNSGRILSLTDTHVFSPRVLNEARLSYSFLRVDAFPQQPINDQTLGIQRSTAAAYPGLGLIQIAPAAGGIAFGTAPLIDVVAQGGTSSASDMISMQMGKHALRLGAEVRLNLNLYDVGFYTRGQIQFLSFNDFLTGSTFVSVFGNGVGRRTLRSWDYNFFAQDDWKVSRKLTVNFGLRYELDTPPYDTQGRLATFDPSLYKPSPLTAGGVPVGPPIAGYVQAGNVSKQFNSADIPKVGKYVIKSIDPNNLAPRIGFASSPLASDHLVIRGGYGIYYSRTSFQYATLGVADPPNYVFGVNLFAPFSNPFFPVPSLSQFPALVPGVALSGTFFDRNIRTPYVQQFNFGTQYAIGHTLFEVGWVGSRGLNLFRQVGINQPAFASAQHPITNAVTGAVITTNTPANASLRAPFQGVSVNGFFQDQSTAQSVYHSLQASATQRFSHGVQFLASYTFAKSLDNASGQGGGAGTGGVVNPGAVGETSGILGNQFNNRANRGLSDFDRRHRFVLSGLWELPTPSFARSGIGKALFHGWQMSGVITAMSGLPIDIIDQSAGSLYGFNGAALSRASWAPGATVSTATNNVPAGYFFNPAAFARPVVAAGQPIPSTGGAFIADAAGTDLGNVGRNVLRGPRQTNVDFSFGKQFAVRERNVVEFRAEFFNLMNHVNLANPISDLNAVAATGGSINAATGQIVNPGQFGQIISASSNPRLIQLALKFRF
jgi:hypothetical protein